MVKVDKNKCIGCGQCASMCSTVFEMKEGKAQVKKGAKTNEKCVDEAIDLCPVSAISK